MISTARLSLALALLAAFSARATEEATPDPSSTQVVSRYQRERATANFGMGTEFGLLQSDTSSLQGLGIWVNYEYYVLERSSIELRLGTAFQVSGFSHLYTSIAIDGNYVFLGETRASRETYWVEERALVTRERPRTFSLSAGGGFEQLILSGATTVVPAPGFSAGLRALWPVSDNALSATLRVGYYLGSVTNFLGLFAGAGMTF